MKWILLSITVLTTVASDLLQSYELKRTPDDFVGARGMARLVKAMVRRQYLIWSIVFQALSFFAFMALVQSQPLSFAVPASAASFIVETALARLLLNERLGGRRSLGALMVAGGILLLAR